MPISPQNDYYNGIQYSVYCLARCIYRGVNTDYKLIEKCTLAVIATGSADYPMRAHNVRTSNSDGRFSKKKDKERSSLHEFGLDAVSSAVATAIARSVVAPFDRVKIISQVHYTSIVNCQNNQHYHPGILTTLNQIYREQGLRALWFGNFTNILRFVPSQVSIIS
ncbi:hypothetical protein QTP88_008967 [Uroleucon formosanum]